MLKVAIVGCGKIADSHAAQIQRIRGCEIVGVCDREPLMARQLYERFPIRQYFSDLQVMLSEAKPDVVHITTPPQSHFQIARLCLESGAHVYVEKPFTVNEQEAQALVTLANERNLKLTAGHDDQFRHAARRMRRLIQSGYLGGEPVHMECYYGYELGTTAYALGLLGDKRHWVRSLPGKLLHNIIAHGIARIAEHMTSDSPQVMAYGFVSPYLKSVGEREIIDELRVVICEEGRKTAYFTFSTQMRPSLHSFTVFGTRNGLALDQDQETLVKLPGTRLKSFASQFISPLLLAEQYVGNVFTNFRTFLANDFHVKAGMKFLIESFYRSILEDAPVPIPYREIILTARIMDDIFAQLNAKQPQAESQGQSLFPAVLQS